MSIKMTDTHASGWSEKSSTAAPALMQTEEKANNAVPLAVYTAYIRASGSLLYAPAILLLLILAQGANISTTLWLSYWTSDAFGFSNGTYIGVFAALGVAQYALMF